MYGYWLRVHRSLAFFEMLWLIIVIGEILIVHSARNNEIVISVRASDECDMRRDVLLIEDMSSETAYLQCKPAGRGAVGFWQWLPCPPGQKFYFTEQKCDVAFHQKISSSSTPLTTLAPHSETTSSPLSVTVVVQAYLNDSCAQGQQCAGGTTCDESTKICKCPLGSYSTPGTKYCQHPFSHLPKTFTNNKISSNIDQLLQASLKNVSPGSSCRDNDVICIGGSYCNPDNKVCSCHDGSTDEGGKCVTFKIETAAVGQRCNQFTKCDGWSVCISNVCQCEMPLVQVGFQCLPEEHSLKKESKPGQSCDKGQMCLGGSICSTVTLRCTCPVGTKDHGDKCFDFIGQAETKLAGVGEHCDVNTDCVIGAYCSAATNPPSCQCLSTHVELNAVCYRIVYPGQRGCEFDDQCSAAYQGAACANSLCICPNGMNAQGQTCRPGGGHLVSPPGGSCAALQQCSGGSLCRNGWCICPDNTMVVSNGMCTFIPTRIVTGSTMEENSNILENVVSTAEMTSAASTTHFISTSTMPSTTSTTTTTESTTTSTTTTIPTTTTSSTTTTTTTTTTPTTTPLPTTVTTQATFPTSTITTPPLIIFTTQPLTTTSHPVVFTTLVQSVPISVFPPETSTNSVTAATTTVPQKNQNNFAFPGDFCTESTSCTGGSKCLYGQCLCDEQHELINRHCILREEALPLASCIDGEICVGGSVCDGTLCQCPSDTIVTNSACVPTTASPTVQTTRRPSVMWAPPMSSCASGERCSGDSMCNRLTLTCECPGDMQPIHGHCVLVVAGNRLPGQTSEENDREFGQNTWDHGSNGFLPKSVIHAGVEEPAGKAVIEQSPVDHPTIGYTARPHVSFPTTSFVPPSSIHAPAHLNEPCARNQDCAGGAVCFHNRCTCPHGSISNQFGQCLVIDPDHLGASGVPLGTECNVHTHCFGSSQCINGRCRCPSGLIQDGPVCISLQGRNVSIGGPCGDKDICQGRSSCIFGVCICQPGTKEKNGICQAVDVRSAGSPKPGQPCSGNEQCSGNSLCVNGTCQCWIGYAIEDDTCVEPPLYPDMPSAPGDPCRHYDDCFGGSYCRLGYCVCPMGTDSINMKCISTDTNGHFALPGKSCAQGEECTGGSFCLDNMCRCPVGMHPHLDGLCRKLDFESLMLPTTTSKYDVVNNLVQPQQPRQPAQPQQPPVVEINHNLLNVSSVPYVPQNPSNLVSYTSGGSSQSGSFVYQNPSQQYPPAGIPISPAGIPISQVATTRAAPLLLGPIPGTPCRNGQVCQNGAVCSIGFCRCPAGLKQLGDSCIPETLSVPPGHMCTTGQTCTGGAECTSGVCLCKSGQKIVGTVCLDDTHEKSSKPDSWNNSLSFDEQQQNFLKSALHCSINDKCSNGAVCIYGSCICPVGKYSSLFECFAEEFNAASGTKTRRGSRPGELCTQGQRCLGASFCARDGYCRCPSGTKNDKGMCRRFQAHQRLNTTRVNNSQSRFASPCPLPENETACQLPNCFCSKTGRTIPGGLAPERTPQFVVLSFDDPVNSKTFEIYQRLFDRKFFNKNGCPIKATFFVSHEWTDYDAVEWLYLQGHEIASNSITHTPLRLQPLARWVADMDGQRTILNKFSGIPVEDIVGMRAPQLALAGDVTFEMMQNYGFLYDNSMTTNPGIEQTPFWPQTLDYKLPWECQNIQCPQSSFPGVWEVPINQFFGFFSNDISHFKRASMVSAAMASNETHESALNLLRRNFKRAHHSNKAPYVLTLTADFFTSIDDLNMEKVLEQFIQELLQKSDVWIVTMKQLIDWMREPTPTHQLSEFKPFQCSNTVSSATTYPTCQTANKCYYRVHKLSGGEHLFTSCHPCSKEYPWLNNPEGN